MSTPDPFYYLGNFKEALAWVVDRNGDLLSDAERSFSERFVGLPLTSQALLVRLIMRRGELFRQSKICYAEIGDIAAAFEPLIALQWVDTEPLLTLRELFRLATRAELAPRFPELRSRMLKEDACASLAERFAESLTFNQWLGTEESVYRVKISGMANCFRLLFFGNFRQQWSEFVMTELGLFKYEPIALDNNSRPFSCRADIESFYALYRCREALYEEVSLTEVLQLLPVGPIETDWLAARREKLRFRVAEAFERQGEMATALMLYKGCRYPEASVRHTRLLERQGRIDEAQVAVALALAQSTSEAERQKVKRIDARLHRKRGIRITAHTPRVVPMTDLELPFASETAVETRVRDHLSRETSPIFYVENSLIRSLFGLLSWEAIFAPLRGAFFHRFHAGPADLLSPAFVSRRQDRFDCCLAQLEDGRYRETMIKTFNDKYGIQSPFVHWRLIDPLLLQLAIRCICASHLKLYFSRLLSDIHENATGLPDLIRFDVQNSDYKLIEVKGPGDRLQDNQKRWIQYCLEHDLPVEVCRVRWTRSEDSAKLRVDSSLTKAPLSASCAAAVPN